MPTSLAWSAGASVLRQGIQFVGTLILARMLDPAAFGSAAIVLTVVLFAQTFTDLGIVPAIVHVSAVSDKLLASAFWANLISGVLLTGLVSALSRPLAAFFNDAKLAPLLILASLNFTVSFAVVQMAVLERTMRFKDVAIVEVTAMLVGWTVAVIAARAGAGPTSLVLAPLATTLCASVLFAGRVRWYPTVGPGKAELRYLWDYSCWLVAFNVVNYWSRSADKLLLGKFSAPATLGLYARAYDLMLLPVQQISTVLARVLLPALASVRQSQEQFRQAWLRSVYASWVLGLPLSLGSAVAAPALIETAFGRQWLPAAPILAVLSVSVPPQLIGRTLGAVFQAHGLTSAQFRLGMTSSAITVGLIAAGLRWGAVGVAAGATAGLYLGIGITTHTVLKVVHGSWRELLGLFPRSLLAALLMAGAAYLPRVFMPAAPSYVVLVTQVLVAAGVYASALTALDHRRLRAEFRDSSLAAPSLV